MFCPKCGQQNPETGKFCRSCGTDLGNVSSALAAPQPAKQLVNHKGKPIHREGAMTKFATGVAFLIISIVLAATGMAGGRNWWFWMLIPAFTMMASGIAQFMQITRLEKGMPVYSAIDQPNAVDAGPKNVLPPQQTEWVSPESRYKTGDLVPPSITENTTRHLEMDSEGKTMTLPKK